MGFSHAVAQTGGEHEMGIAAGLILIAVLVLFVGLQGLACIYYARRMGR